MVHGHEAPTGTPCTKDAHRLGTPVGVPTVVQQGVLTVVQQGVLMVVQQGVLTVGVLTVGVPTVVSPRWCPRFWSLLVQKYRFFGHF